MTEEEFLEQFEALSETIAGLPEVEAKEHHDVLHALVLKAKAAGFALPDGATELDDRLTEAAIEEQFDNLPV